MESFKLGEMLLALNPIYKSLCNFERAYQAALTDLIINILILSGVNKVILLFLWYAYISCGTADLNAKDNSFGDQTSYLMYTTSFGTEVGNLWQILMAALFEIIKKDHRELWMLIFDCTREMPNFDAL